MVTQSKRKNASAFKLVKTRLMTETTSSVALVPFMKRMGSGLQLHRVSYSIRTVTYRLSSFMTTSTYYGTTVVMSRVRTE